MSSSAGERARQELRVESRQWDAKSLETCFQSSPGIFFKNDAAQRHFFDIHYHNETVFGGTQKPSTPLISCFFRKNSKKNFLKVWPDVCIHKKVHSQANLKIRSASSGGDTQAWRVT